MSTDILQEIVHARKQRIQRDGYAPSVDLPKERDLPLQPFLRPPALICEIKRRSPSRASINMEVDPLEQAAYYRAEGIRSISVLTEEEYFSGSLAELRKIKQAFPDLSILRKDFLLDVEDVYTSFLAGADAILLIAAIHSAETLRSMYDYARKLGLAVLVEAHSEEDVNKISPFQPDIVGINCRNLRSFQVDRLHPLILRSAIHWKTELVYESGINSIADADFAYDTGFTAILCGEAVMRNREFCTGLQQSAAGKRAERRAHPRANFWQNIAATIRNKGLQVAAGATAPPLVKICGITNPEDAIMARDAGADILGFVFASSPRQADPALLRELQDLDLLKVAVVSNSLNDEVVELLVGGYIDAIQFHGDESPADCLSVWPSYKALRLSENQLLADTQSETEYPSPRLLLDRWHKTLAGGTGEQVQDSVLKSWNDVLWLAGGLGPDTVATRIQHWKPELIDSSSALEASPGKKDGKKIAAFFREIERTWK